jgi:hypothetical protein
MRLVSTKADGYAGFNILFTADNCESVIRHTDVILSSTTGFSLLAELNDMQLHATDVSHGKTEPSSVFANKFEIPNYFLNLVLRQYNLKVEE